jgi:hypothetical protein
MPANDSNTRQETACRGCCAKAWHGVSGIRPQGSHSLVITMHIRRHISSIVTAVHIAVKDTHRAVPRRGRSLPPQEGWCCAAAQCCSQHCSFASYSGTAGQQVLQRYAVGNGCASLPGLQDPPSYVLSMRFRVCASGPVKMAAQMLQRTVPSQVARVRCCSCVVLRTRPYVSFCVAPQVIAVVAGCCAGAAAALT